MQLLWEIHPESDFVVNTVCLASVVWVQEILLRVFCEGEKRQRIEKRLDESNIIT